MAALASLEISWACSKAAWRLTKRTASTKNSGPARRIVSPAPAEVPLTLRPLALVLASSAVLATAPLAAPAAVVAAPVPAATGVPAPSEPAVQASNGGFVVQLGAFANHANAQVFLAHVQNQMATAEVEPRVRQQKGLWRVYVGPFANRDDARRAAVRIAEAFGVPTSVMGLRMQKEIKQCAEGSCP